MVGSDDGIRNDVLACIGISNDDTCNTTGSRIICGYGSTVYGIVLKSAFGCITDNATNVYVICAVGRTAIGESSVVDEAMYKFSVYFKMFFVIIFLISLKCLRILIKKILKLSQKLL